MKTLLPFLLLSFFSQYLLSQCYQQPTAVKTMDTPRASIIHSSGSSYWWNGNNEYSTLNDPTLSSYLPKLAQFAGGIWLGAKDEQGDLYMRATQYTLCGAYGSGPLLDGGPNLEMADLFNRIWEVNSQDIDAYRADWNDNQSIDNPIPENIKLWPGRGNPFIPQEFGQALPDMKLAPFVDLNQNGIYQPENGDFPDIRNARIAHWWLYNDAGSGAQSQTCEGTTEIAVLAYSFDTENDPTTTYFYEHEISNRSDLQFEEMHIGLWLDSDLACYTDEIIGCQPDNNLTYFYNHDSVNGELENCPSGIPSTNVFDLGSPLFGVKILDGTDRIDPDEGLVDNGLSSFSYFLNPSVGNNDPETLNPTNANAFWNYLRGFWRNGDPITIGGSGYNPGSTEVTNYAFPDAPNDPNGWSMCTSPQGEQDMRSVMGSGPFSLAPGASQKFTFALLITEAVPDFPCPSLDPLFSIANAAQEVYDGIVADQRPELTDLSRLNIFPNPTTDILKIKLEHANIDKIYLYDSHGKLIQSTKEKFVHERQLSIQHLPDGLYILSIKDETGQLYNHRIVKI